MVSTMAFFDMESARLREYGITVSWLVERRCEERRGTRVESGGEGQKTPPPRASRCQPVFFRGPLLGLAGE